MRLPLRFPTYTLPEPPRSTSIDLSNWWQQVNALVGRNLQEIELPNPYVRMLSASTQAISSAGYTGVVWASESTRFPRQSMDPVTTGTSYIEIPFDGVWTVDAQLNWGASTVGLRRMVITKLAGRGTTGELRESVKNPPGSGFSTENQQAATITVPLYKGDRIALQGNQDSGGTIDITGGEHGTFISISGVGIRGTT